MSVQPTSDDVIDPALRQEGPTGPLHILDGQSELNSSLRPSTALPHPPFPAGGPFRAVSGTSGMPCVPRTESTAALSGTPAPSITPAALSGTPAPSITPATPNDPYAVDRASSSPTGNPTAIENAPTTSTNASASGQTSQPLNVAPGVSEDARVVPASGSIPPPINDAIAAGTRGVVLQVPGALVSNAPASGTTTALALHPATPDDSGDPSTLSVTREGAKRPPGRQTWAKGHKLALLIRYKDAYSRACINDTTSDFYDYITKVWLWSFGYDQPIDEDSPTPPVDPPVSLTIYPGLEDDVDDDVKTTRGEYIKMLRLKLRQWFYQQCKTVRQRDTHSEAQALLQSMHPTDAKKPRKLGVLQGYAKWCWADRIKETFDQRWALVEQKFTATKMQGGDLRKEKSAEWMKLQRSVLKELWEREDQETKDAVTAMIEVEHQKAVDATSIDLTPPTSPEQYDQVLKSIAPYLKNIADTILERTGMVCSILLAGPIPDEGGRLAVRSMHAGLTKGAEPRDWPSTDPAGWEEVENRLIRFARMVYTPADMSARALSPTDNGEHEQASGSSSACRNVNNTRSTPSAETENVTTPTVLPAKIGPSTGAAAQTSLTQPRTPTQQAGPPLSGAANSSAAPPQISHPQPQAKKQRPKPRPVIVPSPESNAHTNTLAPPLEPEPTPFSAEAAPPDPLQRHPLGNSTTVVSMGPQSLPLPPVFAPANSAGPQGLLQPTIAPVDDTNPPNDMDAQDLPSSSTPPMDNTGPRGLPWPTPTVAAGSSSSVSAPTGSLPPVLKWTSIPAAFCTQRNFENVGPPPSAPSSPDASSAPSASKLPANIDIADFPIKCRGPFNIVVNRYHWTSHHPRWGICVHGMLQLEISSGFPDKDVRLLPKAQKFRPVEFVEWFRERRRDVLPGGIDIRTLSRSCWAWWLALQPDARGLTKQERPSDVPLTEWNKTVRKPTVSGFYLVLVALVWWGTLLFEQNRRETLREWEQLVDDVAWAVESWSAAEGAQDDDDDSDHGGDENSDNGDDNSETGGPRQEENTADMPVKSIQQAPVQKRRKTSAPASRATKKRRR